MLLSLPLAVAAPGAVTGLTLDNGLELLIAELDRPGVVAVQTWMAVGSRHELEPGATGSAHFLEHLLFAGSEGFDAETREQRLLALGARENAWTNEDVTVYHLLLPVEGLEEVLALEADRLRRPSLEEAAVRREAGAVLGEWRRERNDPAARLDEVLRAAAFPEGGYGHGTLGLEEDVRAMPEAREEVAAFHARHYRPGRARVVVAGDVEAERVRALVEERFGGEAEIAAWIEALEGVTAEDVAGFARTWLVEEQLVIGRLGALK